MCGLSLVWLVFVFVIILDVEENFHLLLHHRWPSQQLLSSCSFCELMKIAVMWLRTDRHCSLSWCLSDVANVSSEMFLIFVVSISNVHVQQITFCWLQLTTVTYYCVEMNLNARHVLHAPLVVSKMLMKAQVLCMQILTMLWHSCFHQWQGR